MESYNTRGSPFWILYGSGTSLTWYLWLLFQEPEEINPDEELEDLCDDKEDDLGGVEEQRSVILHLLSQLKLGMDLTRVSNWSVKTPLLMQQTWMNCLISCLRQSCLAYYNKASYVRLILTAGKEKTDNTSFLY